MCEKEWFPFTPFRARLFRRNMILLTCLKWNLLQKMFISQMTFLLSFYWVLKALTADRHQSNISWRSVLATELELLNQCAEFSDKALHIKLTIHQILKHHLQIFWMTTCRELEQSELKKFWFLFPCDPKQFHWY